MNFRILGPLEIVVDGVNVISTAPKFRQALALLVLRRNSHVKIAEFIDELWSDNPPVSAKTTVQTYVYKIRKLLQRSGCESILHTRPGGYILSISDEAIDLYEFERLVKEGQASLNKEDLETSSKLLSEALSLWRGSALADVAAGEILSAYITRLEESRFRALEQRVEIDLQLGRHLELISELKSLVASYPLHERFHASLMIALHYSGRRSEALDVYKRCRRTTVDELGLEPGEELQRLHQTLLSADPPLGAVVDYRPAHEVQSRGHLEHEWHVSPAELPRDIHDFTARSTDLARIMESLLAARRLCGETNSAPRIAVISGMPGVGKTALAVHAAHRISPYFSDGQLYADLGSSTGNQQEITEVLSGFLHSLGVPPERVPEGLESRSRLFRSVVSNREILVVIDDAASMEQVYPLLPGSHTCAALVTSWRRLCDPHGAHSVFLKPFEQSEAVDFLTRVLHGTRIIEDSEAMAELARSTAGLPAVLRWAAGRLSGREGSLTGEHVRRLTASLADMQGLRFSTVDLRSCYDTAYGTLTHAEQGMVRLLTMLPKEGFTARAAADLFGWDLQTTERGLEALLDVYLLHSVSSASGTTLYAFPEIAWQYAHGVLVSMIQDAVHPRLPIP